MVRSIDCFMCSEVFFCPESLLLHLKEHYTPPGTNYICTFKSCFQKFTVKYNFRNYIIRHFKRNLPEEYKERSSNCANFPETFAETCNKTNPRDTESFDNKCNETSNIDYNENLKDVINSANKFVIQLHSKSNYTRADIIFLQKSIQDCILNPVLHFIENSINDTHCKVSETEAITTVQSLRSGKITADEFDIYWRRCAIYRFKQIEDSSTTAEILNQWPEYLKPSGFKLIEIDFELKYPDAKDLFLKWSFYENKIIHLLNIKVTNAFASKQLNDLMSSDEETKRFGLLWHMHNIFPPQLKTIIGDSGEKLKKKFSISDSQESFAIIASSEKELEVKMDLLKLQNKNIQPRLLIVGSLLEVSKIFLYFDGIQYPILKVLTAVDILFKIFFVFNLEFPIESEIFFYFLQVFFYEMSTSKKYTKIYTIKNEILNLNI